MRSARSNTMTSWPARVSCWAAARPAGPEPTTATRLPVSAVGRTGVTQPSSQARSMISTSTCLMVTGSWLMPSTQAPSHGAGHSRPVNSGKLLVACSRSIAVAPVVAVDEVVPVRDEVAERAAVVAERDAAVHAAAACVAELVDREVLVDLVPVEEAHGHRPPRRQLAPVLQEPGRVTHVVLSSSSRPRCGPVTPGGGHDRFVHVAARRPRPGAAPRAPACSRGA